MRRIISIAAMTASCATAYAGECKGGVCSVPVGGRPTYTVCVPVPPSAVTPIVPTRGLDSFDGKTIAIVGGSFMANVTHPELRRLIQAAHPTAKVYLLSEIGSAGPYPRPGVVRREKEEFQRKLREHGVDAVISGNGGCGLCTPKEVGSCIAAEALGIPSVMIAASGFVAQARHAAQTAGVNSLRIAEYPGVFSSDTRGELLENTRKVLWPQIRRALTADVPTEEKSVNPQEAGASISGTKEELCRVFLDSGWTDGLPINLPTESAVAEFLEFTDLSPETSLGQIPPSQRNVTVKDVAVNGVMSGCLPEHMPILLAFVKAMKAGDFRRPLTSTHAWTPYCWLNGPVARQLGFDNGQGGISSPKNAMIGRFINLAMLNLGGYRIKENRMGTFGYLMPWCIAEDEAHALKIGWRPYHLQKGYALDESALTAASSINWGNNLVPATVDGERIKDMMAWDAVEKSQMAVASGMPCTYRTFLITPGTAGDLAKRYTSKSALERALVETARIPLSQRTFANYWGNPGSALDSSNHSLMRHERRISRREGAATTEIPPWLAWTGIESLPTVPAMAAGKSAFIVTGDASRNKTLCVPGGGFSTVKIELPKNWDSLAESRGYEPLRKFLLKGQ
ncbi:MAG: hypothetical protein E7046_14885 [Lentisphaerae bacterium]|nr:hypothetical protein [Lentisphaerota bacterium]